MHFKYFIHLKDEAETTHSKFKELFFLHIYEKGQLLK